MVGTIKKYTIQEMQAYGKAGSIAQEVLSSIRTILSFGLHKKSVENYTENLKSAENMSIKKGIIVGFLNGINSGFFYCCFGIGLYYGIYLAITDCENYSTANIIQSFFNIMTATFSLGQAFPFLKELVEAREAAKKIYHIIDTKSKIDVFDDKGGKTLRQIKGSIQFENVFFSYPQRTEATILKGLNLNIPAGKTVALVGSRQIANFKNFILIQY
jgi:ABC-type bacteriocin/lantibiotic exporter with double-glycine peptidase domain